MGSYFQFLLLANFDEGVAAFEAVNDPGPQATKEFEQKRTAAIADSHGWKLIVYEKRHADRRTGWSVWWAAYSIAARMSARSRYG
jgi:hypothetical protein